MLAALAGAAVAELIAQLDGHQQQVEQRFERVLAPLAQRRSVLDGLPGQSGGDARGPWREPLIARVFALLRGEAPVEQPGDDRHQIDDRGGAGVVRRGAQHVPIDHDSAAGPVTISVRRRCPSTSSSTNANGASERRVAVERVGLTTSGGGGARR